MVVDKQNGGKSDALNAGLNVVKNELIVCIDADSIMEQDALLRLVKPFLEEKDKKVIGTGGVIRIANSCEILGGKIKNITDFGLFIGIDEGIDGLVHISDISWTRRIKHPSELYKKGDVVQAIVLDIEKENERFSLGIKQLQDDPWASVAQRYEVGKEITGTITNLTDFGVFIELEEGIEGLVHVSEISKEKIKTPVGMYNIGDVITAKVMNINSDERRIGLSIKRLEMEDEQSILSEYVNSMKPATSSFGEILRENLQEKFNEVDQDQSQGDHADDHGKHSLQIDHLGTDLARLEVVPAVDGVPVVQVVLHHRGGADHNPGNRDDRQNADDVLEGWQTQRGHGTICLEHGR